MPIYLFQIRYKEPGMDGTPLVQTTVEADTFEEAQKEFLGEPSISKYKQDEKPTLLNVLFEEIVDTPPPGSIVLQHYTEDGNDVLHVAMKPEKSLLVDEEKLHLAIGVMGQSLVRQIKEKQNAKKKND